MAYRKKDGSDVWHWCKNCTQYPTSGYREQTAKPTTGELCNQCRAKEQSGACSR